MLSFGMTTQNTYRCLCTNAFKSEAVIGFITVEGKYHGEWIYATMITQYDNGVIREWKQYTERIPRWRAPDITTLKSRQIRNPWNPYMINCHYGNGVAQYIELAGGLNNSTVLLKKYDWCARCRACLPTIRAGPRTAPNIDIIEHFLISKVGSDVCHYASSEHDFDIR